MLFSCLATGTLSWHDTLIYVSLVPCLTAVTLSWHETLTYVSPFWAKNIIFRQRLAWIFEIFGSKWITHWDMRFTCSSTYSSLFIRQNLSKQPNELAIAYLQISNLSREPRLKILFLKQFICLVSVIKLVRRGKKTASIQIWIFQIKELSYLPCHVTRLKRFLWHTLPTAPSLGISSQLALPPTNLHAAFGHTTNGSPVAFKGSFRHLKI